jgi:putative ABC transport system permease protein
MTSLRLPLRLARREVRRRPGRTLLVALLVALPVAGMAMAITLIRTDAHSPREEWERTYGQADAAGFRSDVDPVPLPAGSRQVDIASTWIRVKGADGGERAGVEMSDQPLLDPISTGVYDLVAGRAATQPGEVVVSAETADHFGVGVGDELALERPAIAATVVGEVEPVGCLSCRHLLFAPGELPVPSDGMEGSVFTLVDLPDGLSLSELEAIQQAHLGNLEVRERSILPAYRGDDGRGDAVRWSLVIGALVLTVVGIVISAAFAVGARRQLVTLGQLSASGASPATVRAALVLQGTVTGAVGSLAGLALAALLLVLGQPLVERLLDQRTDGYDVRALEVAAVVLIGVGAATLAALLPARTAARVPTLAALAGRRPLAPVSRRLITWGVASMLGGLSLLFIAVLGSQNGSSGDTWALVAIVGGVAELLGACAIAPAFVSRLEPLAHRLRGSLRLGARSLARNRARTGAVVSAVCAAGALAVGAGGLILGSEAQNGVERRVPDDIVIVQTFDAEGGGMTGAIPPDLRDRIVEAVPGAREVAVDGVRTLDTAGPNLPLPWGVTSDLPNGRPPFEGPGWNAALVASDDLLDTLDAGDGVRTALDETGLVVLTTDNVYPPAGDVTVTLPDGRDLHGVAVDHGYTAGYVSNIYVTEGTVEELGLDTEQLATIFEASEPLTPGQRGALEDVQYDTQTGGVEGAPPESYTSLEWGSPDSGPSPFQLELILSGVALLFSLFVVGVSLALAAAESKDERDILTIAGAPPGTLSRSAGARAWLLAVLGAAMAVPVGFLPVVVFARAQRRGSAALVGNDFPLVFPTRTVVLLLVVVPLVVALVSWLSSSTAQRFRPVRVSTAVFE